MPNRLNIKTITYSALFTSLIAVLAQISIPVPFSPVPFTGQTLAIILAGLVLSPLEAGLSMFVYILLAAVGAPVLANGSAGIATLVGPTGGYIFGFVIATIFISIFKGREYSLKRYILVSLLGGIILVHVPGFLWLNFVTKIGLKKALWYGTVLYLPLDIIKVLLASIYAVKVNKQLFVIKKSNSSY